MLDLDSIKEKLSGKKVTLTKKDAIIGATFAIAAVVGSAVSNFNPGTVIFHEQGEAEKAKFGEFSKLAGPQQTINIFSDDPAPASPKKKEPEKKKVPVFDPSKLPSSLPSLNPPRMPAASKIDNTGVYARHASLTNGMRQVLNAGFVLKKFSEPPKGNEDRFSTSFDFERNGTSLEKFELMSIVRTPKMKTIKTARNALDALVEESNAVNVVEETDEYLIYDFAGSGGCQIGKIAVDDKGIYIFGYINLTASSLPETLERGWIDKLKDLK